jgi:hypothetical protein
LRYRADAAELAEAALIIVAVKAERAIRKTERGPRVGGRRRDLEEVKRSTAPSDLRDIGRNRLNP